MRNLNDQWWKIVLMIVVALGMDIGLHFAWAPTPEYQVPVSYFVEHGWFIPVVTLLLLITYFALALIFGSLQARLPGTKLVKGVLFGVAFGGLMVVSAPAMGLLFGSSIIAELRIGLVDGMVIFLLGVLWGRFTAVDGLPHQGPVFAPLAVSVVVVGTVYFLLHWSIYLVLPSLFPAYLTRPVETLVWTFLVGSWVGVMNWIFRNAFANGSFLRQAAGFAGLAFGIFSLINTLFAPVFVAAPTGLLLLNSCAGILCVGAGVWLERMVQHWLLETLRR